MWPRWLSRAWWTPPQGQTLQERYPAGPDAFVTSYSSVNLTDADFVEHPRCYCDRCERKRQAAREEYWQQ